MNAQCDCCEGVHVATPAALFNRPGLTKLDYRAGTYGTFVESMQARLSSPDFPPLAVLKTREPNDAAMAFIDAWSVVGDVLTFYQERIANEGYLRTATEFRSVLELSRLVGYTPRPGVAASVHLAYLLEDGAAPVVIPKGARSNTIPGPGEQMQAFETSEPLLARRDWNVLRPRMAAPLIQPPGSGDTFYLKGTQTDLKPNDPIIVGDAASTAVDKWKFYFIAAVDSDTANDRTRIILHASQETEENVRLARIREETCVAPEIETRQNLIGALSTAPSIPPANAQRLTRSPQMALAPDTDAVPRLLAASRPMLATSLFEGWKNMTPAMRPQIEIYTFRITAAPFGHNAAPRQEWDDGRKKIVTSEWRIDDPWVAADSKSRPLHHDENHIFLDNDYDIAPLSFIAIQRTAGEQPIIATPSAIAHISLAAYGLSGKTVQLTLQEKWLRKGDEFPVVRSAVVFAGSEKLELAETPIVKDVAGCEVELDALCDGLEPGRWLVVSGERSGDAKVHAAEIAMISNVRHEIRRGDDQPAYGEVAHTFITLAECLAYAYRRETITIYGNVVKATHGETRAETLGAGDATRAFQTFELKQPPLTFVSAPTPSGIESTLQIRVNDVLWHEADSMAALGAMDRKYVTRTDDAEKTRVIFGNGEYGERLPTGMENIKAVYRNGIGKAGNVKAGQIALLNTRPLGVKDVVNPVRASGGADRETLSQARRNAPLALLALDRLVSTKDYADFTRTFAGIGKAVSWRTRAGAVQVTIAGVDDIPIDVNSDLHRNLLNALHRFGDPHLRVTLNLRKRSTLVVSARVGIDPDYLWEKVEPKIRAALLDRFSFEAMGIGEAALLSDAFAAIQTVEGVLYSDVDVFDAISDDAILNQFTGAQVAKLGRKDVLATPADAISYLTPDVADTLILQEVTS